MNKKMVVYLMGKILQSAGVLLLLPAVVSWLYHETLTGIYAGVGGGLLVVGTLLS